MRRLRSLFLDDRGQTAAEFVGVLLVVALIVAMVAASGAGDTASVASNDTICRVLEDPDCSAAPVAANDPVEADDPGTAAGDPSGDPVAGGGGAGSARSSSGGAFGPAAAPRGGALGVLDSLREAVGEPLLVVGGAIGDGWNALSDGFVRGDFNRTGYTNPWLEGTRNLGQFLSGVLVVGDLRDGAAAGSLIFESGGRAGWGDLGWAAAGIVPFAGDFAKGLRGASRTAEAVDNVRDANRLAEEAAAAARLADEVAALPPLPRRYSVDGYKGHLQQSDLDAARRELNGEVVALRPDGKPYDHVNEVQEAQEGLLNTIGDIQRRLGRSDLSAAQRVQLERELGRASRMLDHSEQFVPRDGGLPRP